jgi:hypothetical protein
MPCCLPGFIELMDQSPIAERNSGAEPGGEGAGVLEGRNSIARDRGQRRVGFNQLALTAAGDGQVLHRPQWNYLRQGSEQSRLQEIKYAFGSKASPTRQPVGEIAADGRGNADAPQLQRFCLLQT